MEYTNSLMRQLILEHIHSLRDRRVLEKRLIDGMTYSAIALEMELSERQVKTIVYKGEDVLFRHIPP